MVHVVARVLLSLLFIFSAYNSLKNGFDLAGTATFISSKKLPLPEVLAVLGIVAKVIVGASLLTGLYLKFSIPVGILFLSLIVLFFKNPLQDESNVWMALTLLGMIGGLLLLYKVDKDQLR